jgi:hypothetical protein
LGSSGFFAFFRRGKSAKANVARDYCNERRLDAANAAYLQNAARYILTCSAIRICFDGKEELSAACGVKSNVGKGSVWARREGGNEISTQETPVGNGTNCFAADGLAFDCNAIAGKAIDLSKLACGSGGRDKGYERKKKKFHGFTPRLRNVAKERNTRGPALWLELFETVYYFFYKVELLF